MDNCRLQKPAPPYNCISQQGESSYSPRAPSRKSNFRFFAAITTSSTCAPFIALDKGRLDDEIPHLDHLPLLQLRLLHAQRHEGLDELQHE